MYEQGEVGDDLYGDVIVRNDNKNCSDNALIYRSTAARAYTKGEKEVVCDANKMSLPSELDQNLEDTDNNGVPDYIDNLVNGSAADRTAFADTERKRLFEDNDSDGVPNSEDSSPNFNSDDDNFLANLDKIADNVDEVTEQMDFFLQGLGC